MTERQLETATVAVVKILWILSCMQRMAVVNSVTIVDKVTESGPWELLPYPVESSTLPRLQTTRRKGSRWATESHIFSDAIMKWSGDRDGLVNALVR